MKYSGFIGNIQELLVLLSVETDVHCTKNKWVNVEHCTKNEVSR